MSSYKENLQNIPTHNNKAWDYGTVVFIDEYVRTGDKCKAYRTAFPEQNPKNASAGSSRLLSRSDVKEEIKSRMEEFKQANIMDTTEILTLLSSIARGEELDQFGLDASLKDRLSALKELARIQTEIQTRAEQRGDNQLTVRLIRDSKNTEG